MMRSSVRLLSWPRAFGALALLVLSISGQQADARGMHGGGGDADRPF